MEISCESAGLNISLFLVFTLWQQAYIFKRPAKKVKFLRKNKQIFDIYNFKKALKSVRLVRKVISSCFAEYSKKFWQESRTI